MLNKVTVTLEKNQLESAVSEALCLRKTQVTTIIIGDSSIIIGRGDLFPINTEDEEAAPYPECLEDLRGGLNAWLN